MVVVVVVVVAAKGSPLNHAAARMTFFDLYSYTKTLLNLVPLYVLALNGFVSPDTLWNMGICLEKSLC